MICEIVTEGHSKRRLWTNLSLREIRRLVHRRRAHIPVEGLSNGRKFYRCFPPFSIWKGISLFYCHISTIFY